MQGRWKAVIAIALVSLLAAAGAFAGGKGEAAAAGGKVTLAVYGDQGHNLVPLEWIKEEAAAKGIELKVGGRALHLRVRKAEDRVHRGDRRLRRGHLLPGVPRGVRRVRLPEAARGVFLAVHDPKLDDIVPAYQDLYCRYEGKTFALPYDGDVLNFYFRRDLFGDAQEKANYKGRYGKELTVPKTWDELRTVAEFFTRKKGQTLAGKTLDRDFYGFAFLGARGFAYAWWGNIFGSLGGAYFDRELNPQINTPAGVQALGILKGLMPYCPPDVMSLGYEELKNAFLQDRVATMIQWSDVWKKSNDPAISKIVGNCGVAEVPGVLQPDGKVYFRAAAPVGRVIGIPATTKHPKEAYWVAWKLTTDLSTECVSSSATGLDPYRFSHVKNAKAFEEFGSIDEAKAYLDVVMTNLNHLFPDVNIPGSAEYLDALDIAVTSALAGSKEAKAALDQAAAEWNEISKTLDRKKQTVIYNNMLDVWKKYGFWKD